MWSELLGFGDFYYELGVQAVEACMAERPLNGGLMEIEELVVRVRFTGSLAVVLSTRRAPRAVADRCSIPSDCHSFLLDWSGLSR